jgi:lysophospholipase L1-like esterase
VRVENHAKNGRSTRLFVEQGLWQGLLDALKEGDYVFIQFGHNDGAKDKPDRYTPPEDYRANLVRFVKEVRERKATPVLFTPVMRRKFTPGGAFVDQHGVYPGLVREVAAELKVPLIDMHRASERVLVRYGPEESRKLFLQLKPGENPNYPNGVDDNTHFNPRGAEEMAGLAVEGIREAKLGLAKYLVKPAVAFNEHLGRFMLPRPPPPDGYEARVREGEARFTMPLPQRPVWSWRRRETRENAREYAMSVGVSNEGRYYSFGLFLWKYPGAQPARGGVSALIDAGQKSLFERASNGHMIKVPDAEVKVRQDGERLIITVSGRKNVARLFSGRPSQVNFETFIPDEPPIPQIVPVTYEN